MKLINFIRENIKEFFIITGMGLGLGYSVILFCTFMVAYTNGNYQALININNFGEARWEIILVPISIVWILIAHTLYFKSILTNKKAQDVVLKTSSDNRDLIDNKIGYRL